MKKNNYNVDDLVNKIINYLMEVTYFDSNDIKLAEIIIKAKS